MVAALNEERFEVTRENLVAVVQRYVNEGMQPNDAFRRVFDDLDAMGQLEDLARLHGAELIGSLWRQTNHLRRPGANGTMFRHIEAVTPDPSSDDARPSRVVALETLKRNVYLDAMEKVNGRWVRVADLTRNECLSLFRSYRTVATSNEHSARYFRTIAEMLKTDQEVVAQHFDDDKLMRLWKRVKP